MKTTFVYRNFSSEIFPGFYESSLYHSDLLYDYCYGEVPDDGYEWEFDCKNNGWSNYQLKMAQACVDAMKDSFQDNPVGLEFGELNGIDSPAYYNFTTDKLCVEVTVDLDKLKEFCFKTERDEFNKYLHDKWSSKEGFISFVANNVREFEHDIEYDSDYNDVIVEYYLLKYIDFELVLNEVLEQQYLLLDENLLLQDKDGNQFQFEWDNDNDCYKVAEQVK